MLEICEKLSSNPKLSPGDYADLLKALKKVTFIISSLNLWFVNENFLFELVTTSF